MKPWKAALGLTTACTACCAIPMLGLAGGFTAFGSAFMACIGEFKAAGAMLLAVALATTGVWWWRRRQAARSAAVCACADACTPACPPG
jgi:hypothetical protein